MATHPLRVWRRKNELSLEKVAAVLGTTKQNVSKLELRQRNPRADMLRKIAALTNGEVTPNDMLLATETEARA